MPEAHFPLCAFRAFFAVVASIQVVKRLGLMNCLCCSFRARLLLWACFVFISRFLGRVLVCFTLFFSVGREGRFDLVLGGFWSTFAPSPCIYKAMSYGM